MIYKNQLKETIQNEGISQIDLANAAEVAQGTINKICNGQYKPSKTMKSRIIKGLNKKAGKVYETDVIFPE
jgi:DNA-binding XRE family transcriptional regulator